MGHMKTVSCELSQYLQKQLSGKDLFPGGNNIFLPKDDWGFPFILSTSEHELPKSLQKMQHFPDISQLFFLELD